MAAVADTEGLGLGGDNGGRVLGGGGGGGGTRVERQ